MAFLPEMGIAAGSVKRFDTSSKMNVMLEIHCSRNALLRIHSHTGKSGIQEKKQNTLFLNPILPSSAKMILRQLRPFSNANPKG